MTNVSVDSMKWKYAARKKRQELFILRNERTASVRFECEMGEKENGCPIKMQKDLAFLGK